MSNYIIDFEKKNKIDKNHVISFGFPRSGTTLFWNILKDILEDKIVIKTHIMRNNFSNNKKIVIYRDIRNSLVSMMRTMVYDSNENNKINLSDFKSFELQFDSYIDNLIKLIMNNKNVTYVKYEDFINNHNILYDLLESEFNIKISINKRQEISDRYSVKNVKKFYNNNVEGNTFREWDDDTQIHNKHISNVVDNSNNKLYKIYLSEELIKYINLKYGGILKYFEYEL